MKDEASAIDKIINDWKDGKIYKTAVLADTYDRQENNTIMTYIKKMFSLTGLEIQDFTASNNKIASNFFRRLNVQRNTYSLGNGITFNGKSIKDQFGKKFDTILMKAAYKALIHGVCFPFWNGKLNYFEATEFAPLWHEETGVLMAGIRFWQIDHAKPMFAVVYEPDGYTKWKKVEGEGFKVVVEKQRYVKEVVTTVADGTEIVDSRNYSSLPVIPLWGNSLRQSTLIGLQSQIDSYDLIRSGFANDLSDVAQIYWIVENYGGMNDAELARFRDRLKLNHIAGADTSEGGKVTPYTQDVPYQARQTYLEGLRLSIYDDFGAFDVRGFSSGAKTATEIDAAYQPLDENADDFEAQIIEFVQALGALIGLDEDECTPLFKRNRISNATEMVQALAVADWLDEETKICHTPFISVDERKEVLERLSSGTIDRMSGTPINKNAPPELPVDTGEGE